MAASLFNNNSAVGIVALLLSLMCLGTWPALIRLCTWGQHSPQNTNNKWIIIPQGQDRHVCHVYMDYAISYVCSSCIPILTFLVLSSSSSQEYSLPLLLVAIMGGTLLSCGNLCMQWSVVVFGAPLTTVLAIQASLTVVLGTGLNYVLEPSKTAHPKLLLGGVVAFLVAILLATLAHMFYMKQREQYMKCGNECSHGDSSSSSGSNVQQQQQQQTKQGGLIALPTLDSGDEFHATNHPSLSEQEYGLSSSYNNTLPVSPNRADSFYSDTSSIYANNNNNTVGLYIAFLGGLCFGFFSPAFNIAVNNPFSFDNGDGLSVAIANLWFSLAFCASSLLGNVYLMTYYSHVVPRSTVRAYLCGESCSQRRLALLGGLVCALGNLLQFQGGKLAGFATADLVQAFPLVATMWDVFVFGEFRQATIGVLVVLVSMYLAYLLGIVLLACSIDY